MDPLSLRILVSSVVAAVAWIQEPERAREPADLVLEGRVFTATLDAPFAEALALRGSRILAVGNRTDMTLWTGANTRVIRTQGAIVPGFNDAHCHFTVAFGFTYDVDLSAARSLAEIQELVEAYAAAHPEDEVIQGMGWDLSDLPGHDYPHAGQLDEVVADRAVLLWSEGPHGLWVNSKALELGRIDADSPVPPNTVFHRNPDGSPNGMFLGRGLLGLFRFLPFPDLEQIREGILVGFEEAARLGVTSVHESVSPMILPFLTEFHDDGRLGVRFHVWGSLTAGPFGGGPSQHQSLAETHGRDEWITFGTLKGGVDGMPGLRTAWMLEPYDDDPSTRGLVTVTAEQLNAAVASANEVGLQVALHSTGDAGVRLSLGAFGESHSTHGRRNRIEHGFMITDEDLESFAAHDVVASIQPGFLSVDLQKDRYYEKRYGDRIGETMPLRSLLDAGAVVAFGTDFNLTPLNPMVGLFAATSRQTFDGQPEGGWIPDERISIEEAVRAYTYGSAYAEGAEDRKGTLAAGMLADVVVLSEDIFELEPRELLDVQVDVTIVDGKVVFER